MREIDEELATLRGELPDEAAITAALAEFSGLWDALAPGEQSRIVKLLIDRVAYDGEAGRLSITYWPSGIRGLPGELTGSQEDAA